MIRCETVSETLSQHCPDSVFPKWEVCGEENSLVKLSFFKITHNCSFRRDGKHAFACSKQCHRSVGSTVPRTHQVPNFDAAADTTHRVEPSAPGDEH